MKFVKPLCVIYSSYPNCLMQIRNEKKKKKIYILGISSAYTTNAIDVEGHFCHLCRCT